ncbi:MAG TPA: DUF2442 domain-containing protein [Mucilaginibacter sp.]
MKIIHDYIETQSDDVIEIISANYIGDYAVRISFNNGTEKLVDFKPFLFKSLHPSIIKYRDEFLFKQFKIVDGNLNWNDFDLIFPVHNLHEGVVR